MCLPVAAVTGLSSGVKYLFGGIAHSCLGMSALNRRVFGLRSVAVERSQTATGFEPGSFEKSRSSLHIDSQ